MPTDPIRAALEVAGEAAMQAMDDEGAGQLFPPEAQAVAAAAIAAFLEALPRYEEVTGNRALYWPDLLAAAVRRAAKEGNSNGS